MGEMKEDIKGNTNEAVGKAKEMAGDSMNDSSLENEGRMQQDKGQLQEEKGDLEGAVGNDV